MRSVMILGKVLGGEPDTHRWREAVSKARSLRLPIILLQMLIRKEELHTTDPKLLGLLPTDPEWAALLNKVCRTGYTPTELDAYAHILDGESTDARCERLLDCHFFLPEFLYSFVLRSSATITEVTTLSRLIERCHEYYKSGQHHIKGHTAVHRSCHKSGDLPSLDQQRFCRTMRLLTRQCLRLEPRLIVKLADVAARDIEHISAASDEPGKLFMKQCVIFNELLSIFRPRPAMQAVQRAFPNAYLWEAQRILLAMSDGLARPLLVNRGGFQAIRDVLAGQGKNQAEVHSAARHAPTWPPYLQPGDGMDEGVEPEDNWSRAVSAGMLMQEAGFAKEDHDDGLDILQGMTMDGTPTIQQRARVGQGRRVDVWEASIRATRNAQEAWQRFQHPPTADAKPGAAQYGAMLEKLVLREADANGRMWPGDKALNFPTQHEANLAEFEKARLRPPSVAQLYRHMRLNGVRAQGSCLRILVSNAESLETAHRYLLESTENGETVRTLMADEPGPGLKGVSMSLFAAYIQACVRVEGRRGGRQLMRAIRFVDVRLASEHSRWAVHVWGLVLKNLSQHRHALRVSLSQQVDLLLHIMARIESRHGVSVSTLVQFSKCVRKAMRREMAKLLTEVETGRPSALRRLYESQAPGCAVAATAHGAASSTQADSGERKPHVLISTAAGRMRDIFDQLVRRDKGSRELLEGHEMAPLEQMACRTDPVRSEHAYEYMVSLAFVGEFDDMAKTLRWLIGEWEEADLVDAVGKLDEPPAYADFFETLCVFRLLAEPMLEEGVAESIRDAVVRSQLGWTWPDDAAVQSFAEMQGDESIMTLRRVLDGVRSRARRGLGGDGDADSAWTPRVSLTRQTD
ncbi:prefoldin subunit 3 [Drechmeria coniospora]|uniref:Prefoldin subunit 3 n=1 Tax=Drechmeria coniospora TaxID=98403 RepID=A0A151GCG0_DRECN|nr:prefoldin subunit 3 [Drechmeria coniospora]KYK54734.1 prefoldin subunit 3 [Drechmeria coniospora]